MTECRAEEFDEKLQQFVPRIHRLAARGEVEAHHHGGVDAQRPGTAAHHESNSAARRGVLHLGRQYVC